MPSFAIPPLDGSSLRWRCDPAQFAFATTSELPDLTDIVGQPRAVSAVEFGIGIRQDGYNLFLLGPPGIGKRTVVHRCLEAPAGSASTPPDWCYVNSFEEPQRPKAISLPPGRGITFRRDVEQLVEDLENSIPAVLESDEHLGRLQALQREAGDRHERAFEAVAQKATEQQVQLIRTPGGFGLAPVRNGEVMSAEDFEKLSLEEKTQVQEVIGKLQEELRELIEQVPKWQKELREKVKALNRDAVKLAIGHLLTVIKEQYADLPAVLAYLEAVEKDIVERVDGFEPVAPDTPPGLGASPNKPSFDDYEINLLVDNSQTHGAPIITEDHPSYQNLIGRVEHQSHLGALFTDFTLIKAGALHRANGGYLILDCLRLLQQPFAWEALKRALAARSIKIESLGEVLSLISTVSLEPEPIPIDVKVILLGEPLLYYLLHAYDPDFRELFKVAADFDDRVERSPENCQLYAQLIATLARRERLRPLTPAAVARVLEESVRYAEDAERMSTSMESISDLLCEADYWAGQQQHELLDAVDVQRAIDYRVRRSDRLRERVQEEIRRGTILIDTDGGHIGQINGLSVIQLGEFRFGQPTRITATTRLGRGEVVDIEREVELGGAIHSKGVLILSSFLAARYAQHQPLSLSASLVFEQSYGMVEGDSASIAELCALLSALAHTPIQQSFAVTGSVNQFGRTQPIGGVNEKIEGFFDVCRTRGLTGRHGVIIPQSNVKHLMLRHDVVDAVAAGQFHIFAAETVDQVISLLTGLPAGEPDADGNYPAGSINRLVSDRLAELTRLRVRFGGLQEKPTAGDEHPHE